MKQSTKLLSLVLALVMAFSCMSVIGNAELVKSEVTWDYIDDADLTAEQVADLALDLVDNDLLAGMDTIDLSIIGKLRLNKIDYILEDIIDLTGGFVWGIGKGLLGDVGDLDFGPLKNGRSAYQREDGDLEVIGALLELLGNNNNSNIISKVAYGIGTSNGISLGLIGSFLDLGDIGDMLGNIPGMVPELLYDVLVYASYGYPLSMDDIKENKSTLAATYPEVSNLDSMVKEVLYNVLTQPQDYEWVDDDKNPATDDVKVWDEYSYISKSLHAMGENEVKALIDPTSNSLFQILDNLAQYAINDLGIPALNNNLKKALMEAVEVDFNEIDVSKLPAEIKVAFELSKPEYERSYVNYIAYDCLAKANNGGWYYTTMKSVVQENAAGEPLLDKDGNEITEKERKFYKANFGSANEFATLINWDWKFVAPGQSGGTVLSYADITSVDGTIAGGLNNLLGLVFDTALTTETKAAYEAMTGRKGWLKGTNAANINDNIVNVTKYVLVNFGERVFGSDSPYAHYTWDQVKNLSIIDMVALIGPGFFEDAMPQIILPKKADGSYAFTEGVDAQGRSIKIYEFGAVVIRELITGIAPNINYDDVIFAGGSVAKGGANGRQFATHTADEWFNIILNMGVDLGLTYLDQITNFRDFVTGEVYTGLNLDDDHNFDDYLNNVKAADKMGSARWTDNLNAAILWAVQYVGNTLDSSVLAGLDYYTVEGFEKPFDKLSYVLNTILPLGFVSGYSSENFELDAGLLVEGIKDLFTKFDLNVIIKLFGRNRNSAFDGSYNFLDDTNVANGVLTLVNEILQLIFPGENILQSVNGRDNLEAAQSLNVVLQQANLKNTVMYLLRQLYGNKDAILLNALPVVGKLIKGWGTEQAFNTPTVSLDRTIDSNAGVLETQTVTVRNASNGVWRNFTNPATGKEEQDEQYKIKLTGVEAQNYNGKPSDYVTATLVTTTEIDYGQSGTFNYVTKANIPEAGTIVRFVITYQVFDEFGAQLGGKDKDFVLETLCWINFKPTDANTETLSSDNNAKAYSYSPFYTGLTGGWSTIAACSPAAVYREDNRGIAKKQELVISSTSGTVDGITMGTARVKFPNAEFPKTRVYPFKGDYSEKLTGKHDPYLGSDSTETATLTVTGGSVNQAQWEAAKKTPGSTTTIKVRLQNLDKDADVPVDLVIRYYDDVHYNSLNTLVSSELSKNRTLVEYKNSGTSYAGEILTSANEGDYYAADNYSPADNFVLRESNFSTTGINPEEEIAEGATGTTVTKIDNAKAWENYEKALQAAIKGAYQNWNAQSVYNHRELYENLRVAVNDVEYLKKTEEELQAENTGESIDTYVDAIAEDIAAAEGRTVDHHNHTDYKMHRHNRFNDARSDAWYYIHLKNDKEKKIDDIMKYFDYNWMDGADFKALVGEHKYYKYNEATDSVSEETVLKNPNYDILMALLEDFDEEEREGKVEWLEAKAIEYGSQQLLDVQMATTYLDITEERLLPRNHGILRNHLGDEITSAVNEIGRTNNGYTAGSWANYIDALKYADEVYAANNSQKEIFDAKYQLLVQRKRLVKVDTDDIKYEADYSELNALIAQAEYALANKTLYNNSDKEFGQVLAELGMDPIINKWGDEVQLFPGSALLVKERAYGFKDQEKVDDAATALKEALARLKFVGTQITGVPVSTETLVEANEKEGIEAVSADVARIAANQTAALVKELFKVTATGAGTVNVTVSNDVHYTIDTDLEGFAGTNSTVTFYTEHNGVKIPVKTVKIVVKGDINGDGTIDVLDSAYAATVQTEKNELEGCYLLAGDVRDGDRKLTKDDYSDIVNMAVGNEVA